MYVAVHKSPNREQQNMLAVHKTLDCEQQSQTCGQIMMDVNTNEASSFMAFYC